MVSNLQRFKWEFTSETVMKISVPAIILVVIGILLLIGPWTFAPVCEVNGMYVKTATGTNLPMPCGWTARAELGLGALTILAGALLVFSKAPETQRVIGFFGIGIGVLVILFPLYITKMCAMAEHPCNLLTKPVLILLGIAAIAVSCWIIYTAQKEMAP
jgi:hypothetical protein